MSTAVEATETRIRHLERIQAACIATIAAERKLLRIQRANPGAARNQNPGAARNHRSKGGTSLSSRKQIIKLLEDNYPRQFDPREVSRKTGIVKRSPDGRLSTYSLLARLYQEGKIDKERVGRYRARPPARNKKSNGSALNSPLSRRTS